MVELHLLSGGVDSTSVLYRRLAETANPVHVLHLRGTTPGEEAQTLASRRIVVWLASKLRPAEYREFVPTQLVGKPCGNTLFARQGYAAGEYIVRNPFITTVIQGTTGDPADQSESSLFHNQYRAGVCSAVCNGYAPAPTWEAPHITITKAQACRLLPSDLLALCWTCPVPTWTGAIYVPCGKCNKCLELQTAKEAV
jgi:7-cyano-7-deazaguanine synthase in queuosine biosynthesis